MFFNWEHFFQIGGNGAKVLVEFENVFLIGGIFVTIGGIFFLIWGQKIILGSLRKSAFWELYGPLTPKHFTRDVSFQVCSLPRST